MHFNADAASTELLFRMIHSVNQLSIYFAVTHWCEHFGLTEEEKGTRKTSWKEKIRDQRCINMCEITRSKTFGTSSIASGTSLQEHIHNFESLDEVIQFTRVCELALYKHRVSAGRKYQTQPDEVNGFGQLIPLCREYHLCKNNYRVDVVQIYCFRINVKLQ